MCVVCVVVCCGVLWCVVLLWCCCGVVVLCVWCVWRGLARGKTPCVLNTEKCLKKCEKETGKTCGSSHALSKSSEWHHASVCEVGEYIREDRSPSPSPLLLFSSSPSPSPSPSLSFSFSFSLSLSLSLFLFLSLSLFLSSFLLSLFLSSFLLSLFLRSLSLLTSLLSALCSPLSATMTMVTRPVGSLCVHTALTCLSVRVRGLRSIPCLAKMFASCTKQLSWYNYANLVPLGMKWACICAGNECCVWWCLVVFGGVWLC